MKKIGKHLPALFLCALCFLCASVMPAKAGNSYGIDPDAPRADAEDVINYSGSEETYEVKVTGIYEVSAYGGQGGTGIGYHGYYTKVSSNKDGAKGSLASSRVRLEKGTKFTVHVGSVGGTGSVSHKRKSDVSSGPAGWSDGGKGSKIYNFNDGNDEKNASVSSGGGGGSTYLIYEGTTVLSAAGGAGGSMRITCDRHSNELCEGGAGGGSSFVKDAGDLKWKTEDLKKVESDKNKGNGKVVFKLIRPRVGLELQTGSDDWTKEDVTVNAGITSEGDGLPEDCYFWEYEPKDGSDDARSEGAVLGEWTDAASLTVSQNGTITCKLRDVNGTEAEASYNVTNIDRKGPHIDWDLSPEDWTIEPVTLTIHASDEGGCGIADDGYLWSDDTALLPDDEGDYEVLWNATTAKIYEENTSVTVTVRDKLGNRSEKTIEIGVIDRTAPTVRLVPEGKWTSGEMTFTIEAEDLQADGKTPGSGLPEDAYSVDGENYTNERTILVTEPGTVTVWVRDKVGNLTESHISVAYDKKNDSGKSGSDKDKSDRGGNDKGRNDKGGSGKGGKGRGGSGAGSGEAAGSENSAGEEAVPAEDVIPAAVETPVQIPGIDTTSALGNINLNAAREALQAGRRSKRRSATGAEDAMHYGVVTKEEEPAFSQIVQALSGGDEMHVENVEKGASGEAGGKSDADEEIGLTAADGVKNGVLASFSAGAKWVMRIIQKWKHVITYSLGALISFSLLGLGAVLFLVWKRKKRN